jgi:hypothetical protein
VVAASQAHRCRCNGKCDHCHCAARSIQEPPNPQKGLDNNIPSCKTPERIN